MKEIVTPKQDQTTFEWLSDKGLQILGDWGPKLLIGILLLIFGLWIIRRIVKLTGNMLERRGVDPTLRPFLVALTGVVLKVLLFIVVAGQIGIETTSFVAILGAAGLAIGLAFQGGLGNLAGGVLLLVFRPFKVGDVIEAQGEIGTVEEISVFVTKLLTPQNKTAIIPNGALSGGNIINYTAKGKIRADVDFTVRYEDDHQKAMEIITKVMSNHPKILQDPAPVVMSSGLGENGLQLKALPFVAPENYWDVQWGLPAEIKKALGDNGFAPAYPSEIRV